MLILWASADFLYADDEKNEFYLDEGRLTEYINTHNAPLDWKSLLNNEIPVIYIGEVHPSSEVRDELARNMMVFKDAGITHLAMEMLGDEYASAIGKYCCEGKCKNEVVKGLDYFGWDTPSYLRVIDAAKKHGIQVIAMDLPEVDKDKLTAHRNEVERKLKDTGAADWDSTFADFCKLIDDRLVIRDIRMANNIAAVLKQDPNRRVLAFTGAAHVLTKAQPKQLWDLHKIPSKSLRTVVGNYKVTSALDKNGLREKGLLISMPKDKVGFDGYINIPVKYDSPLTRHSNTPPATH